MCKSDGYGRFLSTDVDASCYSDEGVRVWLIVRPTDDCIGAVAFEPVEMISTDVTYDAEMAAYDAMVHSANWDDYQYQIDRIREPLFMENRFYRSDYGFFYEDYVTRPVVGYFLVAAVESRFREGIYTYDDLTDEGKAFYDAVQQLYSGCTLYLATALET